MTDISGTETAAAVISVGGEMTDTVEVLGHHLTASASIGALVDGFTPEDPFLHIRNSAGNVLFDGNISWGLTSSDSPPPLGSIEQIADYLANGYWGGQSHHFDVTQGGTITVNLTGLTSTGQLLARNALTLWGRIIGVYFADVTTGGQIIFDDNESGAFSSVIYSGHITSSARVNVSTQWLTDYYNGTTDSYAFQTFIHEIGHALGLGHGGDYNETARFPSDALFLNDGWPVTVMSYFDQYDNSYFADKGFTFNYAQTPMMADIAAMSLLYGLSTTANSGDTSYAFGVGAGTQCIFDSAGIDWISSTGYWGAQTIDLNPGTFSNINGGIGNLSIALDVVIENASGGNGADTLIGNNAANRLEGRAGNDSLLGGAGDDTLVGGEGDNRLDGGAGVDTVEFYWSGSAALTVNLNAGTAVRGGGGQDTLISIENVGGTVGNDTLIGNNEANALIGYQGNDTFTGGGGNDVLDGGTGLDTAIYSGLFRSYETQVRSGSGTVAGGPEGGSDTLISVEYLQFRDGKFVFDVDGVAAQVTRLYDTVLDRGPDQTGLDFWVDRIDDHGGNLKEVALGFLNSAEFQARTGNLTNREYVDFLYVNALGRYSDAEGRSYWTNQLSSGAADRADLLISFSESAEHRGLTAALVGHGFFDTDDTYQAVALLYDTFAGRLPDAAGLTCWAEAIKNGTFTLDQVADGFASSPEFAQLTQGMSNTEVVNFLYQNTLDRPSDSNGLAYWTARLDGGMDRGDLLLGFSQSNEHFSLLGAHVTNGIDYLS